MSNELITLPEPKRDTLEVDVPIEAMPDPTITDEQALKAFQRSGLTLVQAETVRDMAAVGVYAKGVGVLKIQRGRAMFTQQRLEEAMRLVSEHMHDVCKEKMKPTAKTNNLVRSAGALAGLARQSTESQRLAIEIESITVGSGAPVLESPNQVASFAAKQKVNPISTTIHNHGPTQVHLHEKPQ